MIYMIVQIMKQPTPKMIHVQTYIGIIMNTMILNQIMMNLVMLMKKMSMITMNNWMYGSTNLGDQPDWPTSHLHPTSMLHNCPTAMVSTTLMISSSLLLQMIIMNAPQYMPHHSPTNTKEACACSNLWLIATGVK